MTRFLTLCLMVSTALLTLQAHAGRKGDTRAPEWNTFTAAHYLDERENWWLTWPKSQRDHATACVSCHTAVPYAMARPALRRSLHESAPSPAEETMLRYVVRRVTLWDEVEPFYNDAKSGPRKTQESRGTEAVLNALVLARYDASQGHLRAITRDALATMWKMQLTAGPEAGAWDWLNFHNSPWEADESQYWGATLAAIAVGMAPDNYHNSPEIQPQLEHLRAYLKDHYTAQPLMNRIVLLWASGTIPGLFTPQAKRTLFADIAASQSADGGWSMAKLGNFQRRDKTPESTASDGYATGLTVYALEESGFTGHSTLVRTGLQWLRRNQDPTTGRWYAESLNKKRDPESDAGRFMTDAATSYAVLALEAAKR
jgi:hypothetical protein